MAIAEVISIGGHAQESDFTLCPGFDFAEGGCGFGFSGPEFDCPPELDEENVAIGHHFHLDGIIRSRNNDLFFKAGWIVGFSLEEMAKQQEEAGE